MFSVHFRAIMNIERTSYEVGQKRGWKAVRNGEKKWGFKSEAPEFGRKCVPFPVILASDIPWVFPVCEYEVASTAAAASPGGGQGWGRLLH